MRLQDAMKAQQFSLKNLGTVRLRQKCSRKRTCQPANFCKFRAESYFEPVMAQLGVQAGCFVLRSPDSPATGVVIYILHVGFKGLYAGTKALRGTTFSAFTDD